MAAEAAEVGGEMRRRRAAAAEARARLEAAELASGLALPVLVDALRLLVARGLRHLYQLVERVRCGEWRGELHGEWHGEWRGEGWARALQAFEAGRGAVEARDQEVLPRLLSMAEHTLAQHAPAPAPEVRLDDVLALAGGEGGAWAHRVLCVPLGADNAAIRKAFYRLSLAMPDHNPRDRERATIAQGRSTWPTAP